MASVERRDMTRRIFAETGCDRCEALVRKEQRVTFDPPAWRIIQIGYTGTAGFVPEKTMLLCSDCLNRVYAALDAADGER